MATLQSRIAIVDDDASVLKALTRLLSAHSFNAATYRSAREFLDSLPEGLPDCLIVDLQMPEMTGLELQFQLKRRGIRIPTIVITAHDETGARERCQTAGAIAYLIKPLQGGAFFEAIGEALQSNT